MKNKISFISIYGLCHFIVDFVCAIFILGKLPYIANTYSDFSIAVIIYNFFAFAFQVPIGYVLDKIKLYKYISIVGFSLIGLCYLINYNNIFILATIIGVGNAFFHLEGGVNIYNISKGKAFLNGLFVAPGALGIFLGTTFRDELIKTKFPVFLIFLSIILLLLTQKQQINKELDNNRKTKFNHLRVALIVALIGLSIIVRSIGGSKIIYSWKSGFILSFIYTISIVIGKAFGGLFADRIGITKVALISLTGSAIFLLFGYNIHIFAYIGILLFNVPMSITLTILENTLSKKIACAVGLNTMFQFIGYSICFMNFTINNNIILVGSIFLAMISIYFAYKLYLKGGTRDENN